MSLKTYAVYTRCERCGVYDRDPGWCDLCGKPKDPAAGLDGRPAVEPPPPAVVRAAKPPAARKPASKKKSPRRTKAKPRARRKRRR